MSVSAYFKGKGLTLIPQKIDNLFRLSPKIKEESLDYIYVKKFIEKKKFAPILLKEIFFILKPQGYLIIDYRSSNEIDFHNLEVLFWWLFRGNYNIISHTEGGKNRLIIQKKKSVFLSGDSMSKWTIGIVTNGDRNDWLELIIESIKKQNIPEYEIIICGKYKNRPEKNITYIPFDERADRGWITKKKNLIVEKAKYENLCMIHDRLVFDANWYQGMEKYGNGFELLGCIQKLKNGEQAGDWLTNGGPMYDFYKIAGMEYTDWDYNTYLSGQLFIIKKSIYEKVLWDETTFWLPKTKRDLVADSDFSFRARDLGHIIRFNPYSSFTALSWRHGYVPLRYDPSKGIIPDMLVRRTIRFIARKLYKIEPVNQAMLWVLDILIKIGLYQKIVSRK